MASTWGNSWGTSWGSSWGRVVRGLGFPSGRTRRRYVDLSKQKAGFSRKYFAEMMAAARAHEKALQTAYELREGKRKTALLEAAKLANTTLSEIKRAPETAANEAALVKMRVALESAISSKRLNQAIAQAGIAQAVARAAMAEMEDEEEAIMLLLH